MLEKMEVVLARKSFFASGFLRTHQGKSNGGESSKDDTVTHDYGQNFMLEVFVSGNIDPVSSLVVNLTDVNVAIQTVLMDLDHKHLSYEVPPFNEGVPAHPMSLAKYCFEKLKEELKNLPCELIKVRLQQGEDLWVDYSDVG